MLIKTLKWPAISLLITEAINFGLEAFRTDLRYVFTPPVLSPLLLMYGMWVGYRTIKNGGSYFTAIIAAVVLAVLPLLLETFGFGMVLGFEGRGLFGLFASSIIVFGSLIGSGYALSEKEGTA